MPLPSLTCPRCRRAAEYQATIEMLDPPVGRIDVGYCAACSCLFEHIREKGTSYASTSWPPVCRACRQPVSFASVTGLETDEMVRFQCRDHPEEGWNWHRPTDAWTRADG